MTCRECGADDFRELLQPGPLTATVTLEWPDGRTQRIALGGPRVKVLIERDPEIDWPESRRLGWIVRHPGPVIEIGLMGQPVGDR